MSLKRIIKKIYHLLWFLSCFVVLVIPFTSAKAAIGAPTLNGVEFYVPLAATFLDNTNGRLTQLATNYNNDLKYYFADMSLNGASQHGGNLNFTALTPVVEHSSYMLSVVIGAPVGMKMSTNKLCIAENLGNTITRWNNDMCVTPFYSDAFANVPFNIANQNFSPNTTINYSVIYFGFTSNVTAKSIQVVFNSTSNYNGTVVFGGYRLELLSDNKNLTSADVSSVINSSGLATASSVSQVQRSVNEVKQELSEVGNKVDNVNNTLNDSSVDSSDSSINNMSQNLPTNSVISDLILLPVTFLQSLSNALGSSCSRFSLGSLLGTELFMPCIVIQNYIGSALWSVIDILLSGMFVLIIRKRFVSVFNHVTNLKDGGNEVE